MKYSNKTRRQFWMVNNILIAVMGLYLFSFFFTGSVNTLILLVFAGMIVMGGGLFLWYNSLDNKFRYTWKERGKFMVANELFALMVFLFLFSFMAIVYLYTPMIVIP